MTKSRKNFIWNSFGLSLYVLVSFLLFIVVKLVNGVDIAGIFTYSFSICTLFFYISIFYNRSYQVSNSKYCFNEYFTIRCMTSLISFVLVILFSIISGFKFYKILMILLLMIFRTSDSISECFYGQFQADEKLYKVGVSYAIKSFFGMFAFIVCDILTKNVLLSLVLLDAVNVVTLLFYDFRNYYLDYREDTLFVFNNKLFNILKSSFPVFIFSFLCVYLMNCQKYIIVYYSSNEIQTIFSILIMPATILSLVGNYLIQPFLTRFIFFYKKNNYDEFNSLTKKLSVGLLIFGIIAVTISYFFGIPVLSLVYNIKLTNYRTDLIIIVSASIFIALSVIYSGILTVCNENKSQVYIYLLSSVVATIACLIFRCFGTVRGATLSYLISSILLYFLFLFIYIRIIKNLRKNILLNEHKYSMKHAFVVCAYKESKYLDDCVKSLKQQSVKSPIFISTSTPNRVIEKVAKKYNVKLLINKETKGHVNDFCFAYNSVDAKYVTLCHQDDVYLRDFGKLTIKKMDRSKKPIIAFTDYNELRNNIIVKKNKLLVIKRLINFPLIFFKKSKKIRLLTLSVGNAICSPTLTYCKDIVSVPIVETDFKSNIDWISYIDFARMKGEFIYINKQLLSRRIHEESLTTSVIANSIKQDEDLKIFRMFWPKPIANFLFKIYNKSEKSNKL